MTATITGRSLGEVVRLCRYPVKSLGGQSLRRVRIEPYGLYGDRSHAFVDESKTGFARYITARELPLMLQYQASLDEVPYVRHPQQHFPEVRITSPSGAVLDWGEQLQREMEGQYGAPVTMVRRSAADTELMEVDAGSVLVVTEASIRALERLWGRLLDLRRFRANIVLSHADGEPFEEAEWAGRTLRIGSAVLRAVEPCERCAMIGIDPDTLEKDASLLRLVHERLEGSFGIYCSVVKTGEVRLGEKVSLDARRF
jgi:uncharacterized protein YcbX